MNVLDSAEMAASVVAEKSLCIYNVVRAMLKDYFGIRKPHLRRPDL